MKKISLIALVAFGLIACGEISGIIRVTSALPIVTEKGELVTLQPAGYESELKYDESKRKLEIKIKDVGGKDKKVVMKLPPDAQIPGYSGPFAIKGSDVNQKFDLQGELDTQVSQTEPQTYYSNCTYQTYRQECYMVPYTGPNGQTYYRRECRTYTVTHYGHRQVTAHNKTTTVRVAAEFVSPESAAQMATFAGVRTDTETIYDYYGRCF